jgi:transposase
MSEPGCLFGELPEQTADQRPAIAAPPRLREPQRDQVELRVVDLDSLLPLDHPARAVWAYVEQLDLSPLLDAIKAREGAPGHPPAHPQVPMALWLYATIDAVGSARALARLCEAHVAYQWICGGVSMNYHTLSDFRTAQVTLLDRLLAQGVTGLVSEGLVGLERLAQDGVRVRAAAGAGSYRRRPRLEKLLQDAEARVATLRAEVESDPAASTARQRAARERAARERERTRAALERMNELEAERARRGKTHKQDTAKQKEPRASTTDAQARVMKMADGGYRPAYNGQFASDPQTQVIVAVDLDTTGSDHGLIGPMQEQIGRPTDKPQSSTWSTAASPSLPISKRRIRRTLRFLRRRRPTSMRPTRLRRARTTVQGLQLGASGCRARTARRSTATGPKPSASMPICATAASSACCCGDVTKCGRCCCGLRWRTI